MTVLQSVLVVENSPGDAWLAADALGQRDSGCRVHTAPTLARAIQVLQQAEVDLVLLDLGLPDSWGLHSYAALHPHAPHTPVVILTGGGDEQQAAEALRQGADDYVDKQHADPATLLRVLRLAVARRQGRQRLIDAALRRQRAAQDAAHAQTCARLLLANQELQALNRSMAHDLRNPLHGIIALAALVQADRGSVLSEAASRRLALLAQSAQQMDRLVERLLALARQPGQPLDLGLVDLSALALEVAARLAATEAALQVDWVIEPGLQVHGDRTLLADLLQNLLCNALKFSRGVPRPRIEFGCRHRAGQPSAYFVRDNGVGFDADSAAAARLFQPFQRLATAAVHAGTGLGLACVRAIAERHGGRAWAESAPGAGATFLFSLLPELPA